MKRIVKKLYTILTFDGNQRMNCIKHTFVMIHIKQTSVFSDWNIYATRRIVIAQYWFKESYNTLFYCSFYSYIHYLIISQI